MLYAGTTYSALNDGDLYEAFASLPNNAGVEEVYDPPGIVTGVVGTDGTVDFAVEGTAPVGRSGTEVLATITSNNATPGTGDVETADDVEIMVTIMVMQSEAAAPKSGNDLNLVLYIKHEMTVDLSPVLYRWHRSR